MLADARVRFLDDYKGFSKDQNVYLCFFNGHDHYADWHGACVKIIDFYPNLKNKFKVRNPAVAALGTIFVHESYIRMNPLEAPAAPENGAAAGQLDLRADADLQRRLDAAQSEVEKQKDTIQLLKTGRKRLRHERDQALQVSENLTEEAVRAKQDLANTGTVLRQVLDESQLAANDVRAAKRQRDGAAAPPDGRRRSRW